MDKLWWWYIINFYESLKSYFMVLHLLNYKVPLPRIIHHFLRAERTMEFFW